MMKTLMTASPLVRRSLPRARCRRALMLRVWMFGALCTLLLACGDEGGESDVGATGRVSITGEFPEIALDIRTAQFFENYDDTLDVIIMAETHGACDLAEPRSTFFVVRFPCGPAEERVYPVMPSFTSCAGGGHAEIILAPVAGVFTAPGESHPVMKGGAEAEARSGTVTIDARAASVVSGGFEADFGSGVEISGSFDAPVCP